MSATLGNLKVGDEGQFSKRGKRFAVTWLSEEYTSAEVRYIDSGRTRWVDNRYQTSIYLDPVKLTVDSFKRFMLKLDGRLAEAAVKSGVRVHPLPQSYTESDLIIALERFVAYSYPDYMLDGGFTWSTTPEIDVDWASMIHEPQDISREEYKLGLEALTSWAVHFDVLSGDPVKFLENAVNQADVMYDDFEEAEEDW